jgi:predicted esterase
MAHNVIYITGFGDHRPYAHDKLIKLWKLWGLKPHYCPVGWDLKVAYEDMVSKVEKMADSLAAKGESLSIVGVSAGASLAMNIYADQPEKFNKAIFISGKLLYPETVQETYFEAHPAFRQSVYDADANFKKMSDKDKIKMMTMYAIADNTVPVRASKLGGVKHKRVLTVGHLPAIYISITLYSRAIAKFIKS